MPRERSKSVEASTSPTSPTPYTRINEPAKDLFQSQMIAPAHGTTYYQVVVNDKNEVILRDWPRQRYSERWSRNGRLNPGQSKCDYNAYVRGEWKDNITPIFGREIYEQTLEIVRKAQIEWDKKQKEVVNSVKPSRAVGQLEF